MREANLASELDFAGWRTAARTLRLAGVAPEDVRWIVGGEPDLFGEAPARSAEQPCGFTTPRAFVSLAHDVIQHRSPQRFDRLYRLLWRLAREPGLMEMGGDPDVTAARDMSRAVHRAAHKMKAFVRFREVVGAERETFIAWFEPTHRVVERTAPFFAGRFANQAFSILTPDVCAHWDRERLTFTPGADRSGAPSDDALEDFWRTYYASIFNPARLMPKAMQREMPKRYWRNLPEAALIRGLIEAAEQRTAAMVAAPATTPRRPAPARVVAAPEAGSLAKIAAGVEACQRCGLWRDATQGVSAEGPATARLMLVGEQPGDQEDLAGRPFVGPAGRMLNRALAEAGADRAQIVVTNAVRHFKHELRGKRRLHKTPSAGEVESCRWWLEAERGLVRPRVIVALGATAALAVLGRQLPIKPNRGKPIPLEDGAQALVTYHPSFLLRLADPAAQADAFAALVEDLRLAVRPVAAYVTTMK